jgi:hypothetical protein
MLARPQPEAQRLSHCQLADSRGNFLGTSKNAAGRGATAPLVVVFVEGFATAGAHAHLVYLLFQ